MLKNALLVLFSSALLATAANASPITYTETGTASGTLGATSFSNQVVFISFVSDTTDVTGGSGFFSNNVGTATISIRGGPAITFTDAMYFFDNQVSTAAGIADNVIGGSLLDTFDAAFGSYDGTTAIGPITDTSFFRDDLSYGTADGALNFSSMSGTSIFDASTGAVAATPEPSSLVLFGSGLVGLVGAARRRFVRS